MKKNIIHSVQVEINTTSLATANAIKNSIDDVIKNEIFPRIEKLLEQYQVQLGAGESFQIEALELDLTIEKSKLNSTEMVSELAEQFEKLLLNFQNQKPHSESKMNEEYLIDVQHPLFSTRSLSHHEKNLESFFFFIKTGTKPWWIPNSSALNEVLKPETLSTFIVSNKTAFAQRFLDEIQRESTRKRIIAQFSDETLIQFISNGFSVTTGKEITAQNRIKISRLNSVSSTNYFRDILWEFILFQLIKSSTGTLRFDLKPLVESIFKELSKNDVFSKTAFSSETLIKKSIESIVEFIFTIHNKQVEVPAQIQTEIRIQWEKFSRRSHLQNKKEFSKIDSKTKEQIFQIDEPEVLKSIEKHAQQKIPNAKTATSIPPEGFHFDHAGLILLYPFLGHFFKHIELIDINQNLTDPELAAHILHYIATGKENDWEFDMVFEKYLVGIMIDHPISKNRVITDSIKAEVNSMLNAVKNNWTPMMNSSNELLRYEFLQRPGKLVIDRQHHRIVMEKKTQDILLNKLTWTISIVRFPWRNELLYVEW